MDNYFWRSSCLIFHADFMQIWYLEYSVMLCVCQVLRTQASKTDKKTVTFSLDSIRSITIQSRLQAFHHFQRWISVQIRGSWFKIVHTCSDKNKNVRNSQDIGLQLSINIVKSRRCQGGDRDGVFSSNDGSPLKRFFWAEKKGHSSEGWSWVIYRGWKFPTQFYIKGLWIINHEIRDPVPFNNQDDSWKVRDAGIFVHGSCGFCCWIPPWLAGVSSIKRGTSMPRWCW